MKTIIAHLSEDPLLETVISATSLPELAGGGDVYGGLIRAIISQQLSGKAAATIYNRFLGLFDDKAPAPDQLADVDIPLLRSAGVSNQKSNYLHNIARFFQEHSMEEGFWEGLSDEIVTEKLTSIKGVGEWTAQMILIFTLERPDIFPIGDLSIRQRMSRLYGVEEEGKALQSCLFDIAEKWRPYRSYACRYLWQWEI